MIANYIGKGLTFPITIDEGGSPVTATGFPLVNSSIKMIIGWTLNTRIFLSGFGSNISELLEEPNDDLLKGITEYLIYQSLLTWEKRIDLEDVKVSRTQPERLDIEVKYKLKTSGLEEILVYPFYTSITN